MLKAETAKDEHGFSATDPHFMPREVRAADGERALDEPPRLRAGQKWRFKRVAIDTAWVQGDPEIPCRAVV
jgi:hypothetical protein